MRKLLVVFLVFSVFLFSATALLMAREGKIGEKEEVLHISKDKALIKTGDIYHSLSVKANPNGSKSTIIDTLYYYTVPRNYADYDDGLGGYQSANDTCIHRFTLLAPGTINKFFMQNQTAGTATCYIWNAVNWDSLWYTYPGDYDCEMKVPFGIPLSCAAQTPTEQFTSGKWTPTWNILDLTQVLGQGIYLDDDDRYCWVGYSLDGTGNPKILQDNDYHEESRSLSTLHSQGAHSGWFNWGADVDGERQFVFHMMQIEVEYAAVPPVVEEVFEPSDTFEQQTTIQATIIDMDGDQFNAWIKYWWNSDEDNRDSVSMALVAGDLYTGTIDLPVGDTLNYYIKAVDMNGLSKTSDDYDILRVPEPDPRTALLLLNDSGRSNDSLYTMALDELGYRYFLWDMAEHDGVDLSVIHWGFHTIIDFGWGTELLPISSDASEDFYDVKAFLDAGNNLMLVDMDYLFAWGMPATGSFSAGDFAYDYLGIGTYSNDPDDDGNGDNGGSADIEMYGVRGDAVTKNFPSPDTYGVIDYDLMSWSNWGDYIQANADAVQIFTEKKNASNGMAIRKAGSNFRTITYAFPIELCSDFSKFKTLLQNSLTWLDITKTDIQESPTIASEYSLLQNYPNPFNPGTQIQYSVPKTANVTISVYNLLGNKVLDLVNARQNAGLHTVEWNGIDMYGQEVAAGIYFYEMKANDYNAIRKMFFIK